jgi:putative transposase
MRKAGLRTREKRKFAAAIDSRHTLLVTENVLDRQFDRGEPNRAWLG